MTLEDAANKLDVPGHKGPHPEEYHAEVFNRLRRATQGLDGDAYSAAFRTELDSISADVASVGSYLNKLVTKK